MNRVYHLFEGTGPFVAAALDRLEARAGGIRVEGLTSSPWEGKNLITLLVSAGREREPAATPATRGETADELLRTAVTLIRPGTGSDDLIREIDAHLGITGRITDPPV